ncbi:hypothetical protein L2E82_50926 [Cichorium intybus]|nr:hypothetical protein L2E82_50926 [Cichorium intybus]
MKSYPEGQIICSGLRFSVADPLKVLERVQKKSHRKVKLLSPISTLPVEEPKKPEQKEPQKSEEEKDQLLPVIMVVLKVHMHCEASAEEIRKRILRMKEAKLTKNAPTDLDYERDKKFSKAKEAELLMQNNELYGEKSIYHW